jgi:serine/threonine-protein kinase
MPTDSSVDPRALAKSAGRTDTERHTLPQLVRAPLTGSLPGDYVELTARRLGITAASAGAVHVVYLVLYRTVFVSQSHTTGMLAGVAGLVASAAVAGYLLRGPRTASRTVAVAVAYEIFLAFGLALAESASVDYAKPSAQVPWCAVLIVLFPFLIPASTRVVLSAGLASATTVPLAIAVTCAISGRPWPDAAVVWSYVLPPFLCAFLAWAPTSAVHRLGAAVQHARRLGNYELVERLGQGGMGEVWRANHRLLARPAAVKLIKAEMLGAKHSTARSALMRRFEKEAQVTASLDSAHTVELYDFGVSPDGVLFYVMELLHGVDIQALVERFGPVPSERVVHLLVQACDSLEDAHRRGLIHRDIKPANLFLARKGDTYDFLKVLDFGLAKRWRAGEDVELADTLQSLSHAQSLQTGLGQIVGTPAFLAPEAALGEQAVDERADLYALGCVGYWLLTGTMVFEETSSVGMAVAHVTKEPVPPSLRTDRPIAAELERIVLTCLQKDRERRPPSAAALRELLSAIPLVEPWSRARAVEWWREHLAESEIHARSSSRG